MTLQGAGGQANPGEGALSDITGGWGVKPMRVRGGEGGAKDRLLKILPNITLSEKLFRLLCLLCWEELKMRTVKNITN